MVLKHTSWTALTLESTWNIFLQCNQVAYIKDTFFCHMMKCTVKLLILSVISLS